jgi:hypothetical protein
MEPPTDRHFADMQFVAPLRLPVQLLPVASLNPSRRQK